MRSFINGRGTWTYLSGSLELPEVRAAKQAAAEHYRRIFELQHAPAAGSRNSRAQKPEWSLPARRERSLPPPRLALPATDPAKIWQLPDTTGLKHEVIMHGGRDPFDSAARLAGGKLVVAHTPDEVRAAINENTAMIYTQSLGKTLEQVIAISQRQRRCRCCSTTPPGFRPSKI